MSRPPRTARQLGQAMFEFALVAPILLLVMLVIVDFGRVFLDMAELENGAREGARQAVLLGNAASNTQTGIPTEGGGSLPGVLPELRKMAPLGFPITYQDSASQSAPPTYGSYSENGAGKPGSITLSPSALNNVAYVFVYELQPDGSALWPTGAKARTGGYEYVVVDVKMKFQPATLLVMGPNGYYALDFQTVEREEF